WARSHAAPRPTSRRGPVDFGDRDSTMSVRPKSERHRNTFEWGRSNFLQEARTLARFEHPSIVRVTGVFEANATAYMVMRFQERRQLRCVAPQLRQATLAGRTGPHHRAFARSSPTDAREGFFAPRHRSRQYSRAQKWQPCAVRFWRGTPGRRRNEPLADRHREGLQLRRLPPTRRLARAAGSLGGGGWPGVAAGLFALLAAAYGGFEYARWQAPGGGGFLEARLPHSPDTTAAQADRTRLDADAKGPRSDVDAARRQAELDAERRRREEAERIVDAEAEAARRANAEAEERRKQQGRARTAAAVLGTEERATFVKRVQTVLKQGRCCYDGAVSGRSIDAQESIDRFVAAAAQKGNPNIARIELAKATAADFEAWLRDASEITGPVCTPAPASAKPQTARAPARRDAENERPSRHAPDAKPQRQAAGGARPGSGGTCGGWMSTTPHARTAPVAPAGRPPVDAGASEQISGGSLPATLSP